MDAANYVGNSALGVSKDVPETQAYGFKMEVRELTVVAHAGSTSDTKVTDPMELTTVKATAPATLEGDDDSDKFYFGYYTAGAATARYKAGQFGTNDHWRLISFEVGLNGSNLNGYTEAEAIALLDEATTNNGYTVSVATETYQKTADTAIQTKTYYVLNGTSGLMEAVGTPSLANIGDYFEKDGTSRAKIIKAASDTQKPTTAYSATSITDFEASAILPVANGKTYYFGMYIDGDGPNDGSRDIKTQINITVSRGNVA